MEINKMKAAVVGCGVITNTYIPNLQNKFKIIDLVAYSNRSAQRAEQTAAAYNIKALSYEEILNDPSIEMILNLTAPAAHYQITKQALEHGKHVFTEKMIAVELAEGKELLDLPFDMGGYYLTFPTPSAVDGRSQRPAPHTLPLSFTSFHSLPPATCLVPLCLLWGHCTGSEKILGGRILR